MKKRCFAFLFLAGFALFSSVKADRIPPARPVVTSIEIFVRQNGVVHRQVLVEDDKMGMVLGYLRATNSPFPVEEMPADSSLPLHVIRVNLSDGSCHLYEQLADRYFRKDGAPWKAIDPDQGSKLTKLEKFASSNTL